MAAPLPDIRQREQGRMSREEQLSLTLQGHTPVQDDELDVFLQLFDKELSEVESGRTLLTIRLAQLLEVS